MDERITRSVEENAKYANDHGYELVSGGANGVDSIAEAIYVGNEEYGFVVPRYIFTPQWALELFKDDPEEWMRLLEIAKENHPAWFAVRRQGLFVTALMVRNVAIVETADLVLAWPSADRKGGTEHGINVARSLGKPLEIM